MRLFIFVRVREIRQYKWGKGKDPVEGKRLKMKGRRGLFMEE